MDDDTVEGREVPFGHPDAERIITGNLKFLELVAGKCDQFCGHCGWPLQVTRNPRYSDFEWGEICATCADIRSCLLNTNTLLKNGLYFRTAHGLWVEERKKMIEEYKQKRRNLGLDPGGGLGGIP